MKVLSISSVSLSICVGNGTPVKIRFSLIYRVWRSICLS
jgi:hypothetical protein